ncbi:MAG: signal peptide peptidase SppA [Campylobacteraceae bacterium]|jgi:protease-4|nr:signal peptide peptidase SppA [Campylobacteraceae bacterium]
MSEQNVEPQKGITVFGVIKGILGFIQNYFKSLIFILILFVIFIAPNLSSTQESANLVRIDLSGVIMESDTLVRDIQNAFESDNIKGVLFVVNSPGGAVSPSLEISMALKRLAEKKPVVAYAAGSMASGSYYASIHATHIIANPGSMIGSIGVIMQSPNIEELAKKVGISEQVVSAGDYKQAGTIMRQWTPKERESLQELIDDIYELFVDDIVKARGLDKAKASEFANARVFIASKAQKAGLIDAVGSIQDAQDALLKLSNVTEPSWQEPDLIEKFSKRFAVEMRSQISTLFYGIGAY